MTISERRIGLQEGLLKHAADLVKERLLAHEADIRHYIAIEWLSKATVAGAIGIVLFFIMKVVNIV